MQVPNHCLTVALTATIYNFDTELADIDRGVYQTLALRLARQPSETPEFMLTRLLAYCLDTPKASSLPRVWRLATIRPCSCGT